MSENEQNETDPLKGARILVVEDEKPIRILVLRRLVSQGATVTTAVNGKDALRVLMNETSPFDLIITDVSMPEMNGIELCQTIKNDEPYQLHASTPIIILSSYANIEAQRREILEKSQANDALHKPFEKEELYALARKTIIESRFPRPN